MDAYGSKDRESLLDAIVQSISYILFANNREGRVVFANEAYCRAFDVEISYVIGKNALELYGDKNIAAAIEKTTE